MNELAVLLGLELVTSLAEASEHLAERVLGGQNDREASQSRTAAGWLRGAVAGPDVERQPVRESAARTQIGETESRRIHVLAKADQIAVEAERRIELGYVEMEVPDSRARRQQRLIETAIGQVRQHLVDVERLGDAVSAPFDVDQPQLSRLS